MPKKKLQRATRARSTHAVEHIGSVAARALPTPKADRRHPDGRQRRHSLQSDNGRTPSTVSVSLCQAAAASARPRAP
eukprot:scaffold27710_cov140-Isochrysis_galbana.AAC.1